MHKFRFLILKNTFESEFLCIFDTTLFTSPGIRSLFMGSDQMGSAGSTIGLSPFKIWIPPCGVAALIFLFSSISGSRYPEHPDFLNNFVHFLEFGLLGYFLARALHYGFSFSRVRILLWTIAICASFGLLDEAHQFLVPERVFDLMDLLFDSLGAAAGSGAFLFLRTLKTDSSRSGTATTPGMND